MLLKFPKGKQREFMNNIISSVGSERKLARLSKIPKASISDYRTEKINIPEHKFNVFCNLSNLDSKDILKNIIRLNDNWGQTIGGIECVKSKKRKGTYDSQLKSAQKQWHKFMKKNHETEYYKIQYERFKKVGSYKLKTLRGEKVRNSLEKYVADSLFEWGFNYEYEPYLKANGKSYFPDFKIGNVIIECTSWNGVGKSYSLMEKFKNLKKDGFFVMCVIPQRLSKHYLNISKHIIHEENFRAARLAQTISTFQ